MKIRKKFFAIVLSTTLSTTVAFAATSFTDVPNNAPYAKDIEYCYNNGIMNGTSETMFSPDELLTQEQVIEILYRTSGSPNVRAVNLPYTDTKNISDWAVNSINWAYANGIINDEENTVFEPNKYITYKEMSNILSKFLNNEQNSERLNFDIKDITAVNQNGHITRAEMATIISQFLNNEKNAEKSNSKVTQAQITNEETPDIHVRFNQTEFDVVLYDNEITQVLMSQVPSYSMMLPLSYDMDSTYKYYDIPSSYHSMLQISPEDIKTVHAGDIVLNDKGRLILYYKDSEITSGNYMKVGYVRDMTGIADELGTDSINFYVSEYSES